MHIPSLGLTQARTGRAETATAATAAAMDAMMAMQLEKLCQSEVRSAFQGT